MRISRQTVVILFVFRFLLVNGWRPTKANFSHRPLAAWLSHSSALRRAPPQPVPFAKHLAPPHSTATQDEEPQQFAVIAVVAPLKYLGPYPCLGLRFPDVPSLKSVDATDSSDGAGACLDFILDTGANVNTIHNDIVESLGLPLAIAAEDLNLLGAAGVGGAFDACNIYELGTCKLVGLPPGQDSIFMTNLTAASMPRPPPFGNGLLGLIFFLSFPAGVEFDWYGTDGDPPTMIFYYGTKTLPNVLDGMVRVKLERLPVQILTLTINVNGTDITAILDTGSPITILSPKAAEKAGIETVQELAVEGASGDKDILANFPIGVKIGGVDGGQATLHRSMGPVTVRAGDATLGSAPLFVGDLPGLDIMGKFSSDAPPSAVLGLDFLRRAYRMVLKVGEESELWIEELRNQPRWDGKKGYNEA